MHIATFLQDLAAIMIVAGVVTILFHQLKQPVVLGYILAGVILGQHTPPFSFIHDENIIKILAELGVIFLMFSLGLEFSIRKLFQIGTAALVPALAEIILMILVGYGIGRFFGWNQIDSLFLGAMLAISSTTIIIKALTELKMTKESFAQLIFAILIIEDILAIGILALLSSIAISGTLNIHDLIITFGKLLVFLVVSLVVGILIVPKLLAYVARFNSKEMLLVTVLGLCFGFSLLVIKFDYSIALGAFLIGAIMAESHEIESIEKLIEPLTNMFSAIFFVSIGLLVDPKILLTYWIPIIVITVALVIGKILVCSLGAFVAGRDGKTSMRVGMGLAQIGEFSFIIASLGISLNVMSPYLYPIIVAISAITTFLTPYLIKFADPFASFLASKISPNISHIFTTYTAWLKKMGKKDESKLIKPMVKRGLLQIFVNLILIIAIFITGSYLSHVMELDFLQYTEIYNAIIWGVALIVSLPFLIAIYCKLKELSMVIMDVGIKKSDKSNPKWRRITSEIIPVIGMLCIALMIIALSQRILPPIGLSILILVIVVALAAVMWSRFIKLHSRLQIAFMDSFKNDKKI